MGMGLIPLCFKQGEDADSLGLTGFEKYTIEMPTDMKKIKPGMDVNVKTDDGKSFKCTLRFDTQVSCNSHVSQQRASCDLQSLLKCSISLHSLHGCTILTRFGYFSSKDIGVIKLTERVIFD